MMRPTRFFLRTAGALAIASALMGGCGPARTLEPAATADVPIGLVVPLQGVLGENAVDWRDAVKLAASRRAEQKQVKCD